MKTGKSFWYLLWLVLLLSKGLVLQAQQNLHPNRQQQLLEEQKNYYAKLSARRQWVIFKDGTCLQPGDSGVNVRGLQNNLLLTRDLDSSSANFHSYIFTTVLQEAVRKFQKRHGILADGTVGQQTLEALNITPAQRVSQLEINLVRWKAFPTGPGRPVLLVNIPEYMLHLYDSLRQPVWQTRIVVGLTRPGFHTKTFNDTIYHLVVNPSWHVPNSIIRNEIIPILKTDPGYLRRNHMSVYREQANRSKRVKTPAINWHNADPARDGFTIIQKPGPWNALGKLKFIFPNSYSIYLHDTPAKALFAHQNRAYSHGCVRVQHPDSLALYLLNTDWKNLKEVSSILKSRVPDKKIRLPNPVAINICYFTCWVDDAGVLQFRKDIYGLDAKAAANPAI